MEQKNLEDLARIITDDSIDIPTYLRNLIIHMAKRNESLEYIELLKERREVEQFTEVDLLLIKARLMIQAISVHGRIKPMREGMTWDHEDSFFIDEDMGVAQLHFVIDNGSKSHSTEMYPISEKGQKVWEQIYS